MKVRVRLGVLAAKVVDVLVIAFVLIQIIAHLPANMPFWLDRTIRRVLHVLRRDDLANPDDMEDVIELVFTALALLVGVAVVWGGHALIRRRLGSARSGQSGPASGLQDRK